MSRQELEYTLKEAFMSDPDVGTARITITMIEGDILLEGEVDNLHAKARAGAIARSLAKNCHIDNSLTVAANRPPTDAELTKLAQEALAADPRFTKELGVRVLNGIATMLGVAPTMEVLLEAEDLVARLPGIARIHRDVRFTDSVDVGALDTTYHLDDQSIIDEVAKHLVSIEPGIQERVTVRSERGTVYLSGYVLNGCDRLKVVRAAYQARGVHRVHNDLVALDGTTGGNEALETKIRALIGKPCDDATTGYIGVQVVDDTAFLFGTAEKPEGVEEAGRLAASVEGIRHVVNEIEPMDRQKA
ncbi:MAG TPA: BON domain-containing protein [Chroococcales cyanobacterium]|jgi:osmotically-inducible protein OsmY